MLVAPLVFQLSLLLAPKMIDGGVEENELMAGLFLVRAGVDNEDSSATRTASLQMWSRKHTLASPHSSTTSRYRLRRVLPVVLTDRRFSSGVFEPITRPQDVLLAEGPA